MGSRICAALNAVVTVVLTYRLVIKGTVGEFDTFGFLILLSALVTLGCWKCWRWMVIVAGILIMLTALGFAVLAGAYNAMLQTTEVDFVILLAALVWILEIVSMMASGKRPARPGDEEPHPWD